jgi:hypothetical protein
MFIKISVESDQLITKTKRDKSGTYQVQEAWAFCHGPNGPHPHPQRIELFPPKNGNAVNPYPVGEYTLAPDSLSVRYSRFDVFTRLIPWEEAVKAARELIVAEKKAA